MTTDAIAQIKTAEENANSRVELVAAEAAESLRRKKADCEVKLSASREECRLDFDKKCADAQNEANGLYIEAENEALGEAQVFVRRSSANLPDAVRFIVGGIIGHGSK